MPGWQGANQEAHWACVTEEQRRQAAHPGRRLPYEWLLQSTSFISTTLLSGGADDSYRGRNKGAAEEHAADRPPPEKSREGRSHQEA